MEPSELVPDAARLLAALERTGDPFCGDDWSLVQILRFFIADHTPRAACEHGVPDGDYCRPCALERSRAEAAYVAEFGGERGP